MSKDRFYLFSTLQGIMEEIDMRKIRIPSFCYRSQDQAISDLAKSIDEKGLLQPITVRAKDAYYEIVIGHRRYMACKSLGCKKITCSVVELDDRGAFEASLIENMQTKGLNPIEEAKAYKDYVTRYGRGSISGLARQLGKSVSYIDKRTRLLDLPGDIIDMVASTDISVSSAEELLPLKCAREQSEIARIVRNDGLTLKEVRELATESKRREGEEETTTYHYRDRWMFETQITDLNSNAQKSYDKAIIAVRAAMNKIISIMDNIEGNWIVYEMLREHKEALHKEIDVLIREKRKILAQLY